jgi:hypothetical protein
VRSQVFLCKLCTSANDFRSITPGSKSKVKSSVQRAIRTQIVQTYPLLAPYIDEIIPKKEQLDVMKMYCPSSLASRDHLARPTRPC